MTKTIAHSDISGWMGFAMMRGGRVTKVDGQVGSYAPHLGVTVTAGGLSTGALALGATLLKFTAPLLLASASSAAMAQAQDACVNNGNSDFDCVDGGAPATNTQVLDGRGDGNATDVTLEDGFDVDTAVSGSTAIEVADFTGISIIGSGGNSIVGSGLGIGAINTGMGDISISQIDEVVGSRDFRFGSSGDYGILGQTDFGNITVSGIGTVSGSRRAVSVRTLEGNISIQDVGTNGGINVTQTNSPSLSYAIWAKNYRGGDIEIGTSAPVGPITGQFGAIYAVSQTYFAGAGSGAVRIDTSGGAISAGAAPYSGFSNFTVIKAENRTAAGEVSIVTGDITSNGNAFAIKALSQAAEGISIDTTAGSISSSSGIYAEANNRQAPISIMTGDVAVSNSGISALGAGDITIDTSLGTVTKTSGISPAVYARSGSGESISVTTADVDSANAGGVNVSVFGFASSVNIDTLAGAITARGDAIRVQKSSFFTPAPVTITTGDLTSTFSSGVYVDNFGNGPTIIDTTGGTISGGASGIGVWSRSGSITITTASVDSVSGAAITALTGSNFVSVDTTAGAVSGGNGIVVRNFRQNVDVTTGDVTATRSGVFVYTKGDVSVDTTAGAVVAGRDGIYVENANAYLGAPDGNITIDVADVSAARAINTRAGDGTTTIRVVDGATIEGTSDAGVRVNSLGGAIAFSAGDNVAISGEGYGVYLRSNQGDITLDGGAGFTVTGTRRGRDSAAVWIETRSGSISVEGLDSVTGVYANGIHTQTYYGDITIGETSQLGDVVSGASGTAIAAEVRRSGALTINTTNGSISGGLFGISAAIEGGVDDLSIVTGDVSASFAMDTVAPFSVGIRAYNRGSGDIVIDTTGGSVSGARAGIRAAGSRGGDVTVVTADVTATAYDAIHARGSGNIVIDTTAGTIAGGTSGINIADAYGRVDISAGNISVASGSQSGIQVNNSGRADTSIRIAQGATVAATEGGTAIDVSTRGDILVEGDNSNLTGGSGVFARSRYGTVTIRDFDTISGIFARSSQSDVTISNIGTATGTIRALSYGAYGAVSIQDVGRAGGITTRFDGISVGRLSGSVFIGNQVAVGDIVAGFSGIVSSTSGTFNPDTHVEIDATVNSVTAGESGIRSILGGARGTMTIRSGDITAGAYGVYIRHDSTDQLTVDTTAGSISSGNSGLKVITGVLAQADLKTGQITSTFGDGIHVDSSGTLSIETTADVTGGERGIFASSYNLPTTITLADGSSVTGERADGIRVEAEGGDIDISGAAAVSGANYGLYLRSERRFFFSPVNPANISVRGLASIEGANGLTAISEYGDIVIADNGDITGRAGSGVVARSTAGSITIDSTGGMVSGFGGNAIGVGSITGNISITTGDVNSAGGRAALLATTRLIGEVILDTSAGTVTSDGDGISVSNFGFGKTAVTTADVNAGYGGIVVYANGPIAIDTTAGAVSAGLNGLEIISNGTGDILVETSDVSSTAAGGILIRSQIDPGSSVVVDTTQGKIDSRFDGIAFSGLTEDSDVTIRTADVSSGQTGISVISGTNSTADIDTTGGSISGTQSGLSVSTGSGSSIAINTADVSGEIREGIFASINAMDDSTSGAILINSSAGAVTGGRHGIGVIFGGAGTLDITTADVTGGESGIRILDTTTTSEIAIDSTRGTVTGVSDAISISKAGAGSVTIATSDVTSLEGIGIRIGEETGQPTGNFSLNSTAGTVSGARGIVAFGRSILLNVGSVQATTGSAIATYGTATNDIAIAAGASVGSLTDQAIFARAGDVTIANAGTITGSVTLGDGKDSLTNTSSTSVNLRAFADTDMDGIRDTESVAISDFGAGTDTFTNAAGGVVRLMTVADQAGFTVGTDDDTAPTAVDIAGAYASNAAENAGGTAMAGIANTGIEQAQLLNLELFDNAGSIILQDALTGGTRAIAGDLLVISGGATAGTSGGGEFRSNGGSLLLDVFLNDGSSDLADMLVVDTTTLGMGGATTISIAASAGSTGAGTDLDGDGMWTEGEGILLVDVLDAANSNSGAFALAGGEFVSNGALYNLFYGATGGDWYLANLLASDDVGFCQTSRVEGGMQTFDAALGCFADESFALADTATARIIEGAGGADTIRVTGSASVSQGIYGGLAGQDGSAAQDTGDTILIDTSGTIGIVDGVLGDDTITLANGTVASATGNAGNDTLVLSGATVTGAVSGASGEDRITLSGGGAASVSGGDDADTIILDGSAIAGAITGDGGADSIVLASGSAGSVSGGAGMDSITLNGATVSGPIAGDGESDSINLKSGSAGSVSGGTGADNIVLNGATIMGAISGDADADTITLTSGTAGSVSGDDGADRITLQGADVGGAISGDSGDDIIAATSGNAGSISGDAGADIISLAGATISGAVSGDAGGDTIALAGGSAASVSGGDDADSIALGGAAIAGAISGDSGADTINLGSGGAGSVSGDAGADVITLAGATVAGAISGNADADRIMASSGLAMSISGGDADDTISLSGATIGGAITGDAGADTIMVSGGSATSVDGGTDGDMIAVSGGAISGDVSGGDGADTLSLTGGTLGSASGGAGADGITLDGATVTGAIGGGADDDTIALDSGNAASVSGDGGADTIGLQGATIAGAVAGGDEDDTLLLTAGSSGTVTGDAGSDTIMLAGATVAGAISGGADADTISATNGTAAGISGDAGADSITLAGATISGAVTGDAGADTLAITAGIAGSIDGGTDTDTIAVAGGTVLGTVAGGAGADSLSLTGGTVGSVSGDAGLDTITLDGTVVTGLIDGGADADTIVLAAGSAAAVAGGAGADGITLYSATVTGAIAGGADGDTIALNAGSADSVTGDGGADTIGLQGATIAGAVEGGADADVIMASSGSAMSLSGGDADDTISLSGATIGGAITGDAGADTILVSGGSATSVDGGSEGDMIAVTGGAISGDVAGGEGADTLSLTGGMLGSASGNAGADSITIDGATVTGAIAGGADGDTIALDSGNAASVSGDGGAD
ncbi:beta strand repeat-containing protein, partial [Parerythrobacter jejuensis]